MEMACCIMEGCHASLCFALPFAETLVYLTHEPQLIAKLCAEVEDIFHKISTNSMYTHILKGFKNDFNFEVLRMYYGFNEEIVWRISLISLFSLTSYDILQRGGHLLLRDA